MADAGSLSATVQALKTGSPGDKLEACRSLRRALVGHPDNVEAAIQAGAAPTLCEALRSDNQALALEAACCIANVAAGSAEHTALVAPAVPVMEQWLERDDALCQEQAAWVIGNVAAEDAEARAALIARGAVPKLARLLQSKDPSMLARAYWALSNMARGDRSSGKPFMDAGVPDALALHLPSAGEDVVAEATWLAAFLCAREVEVVEALVQRGAVESIAAHCGSASLRVIVPAFRALGNVASITDAGAARVLACNQVLPAIHTALQPATSEEHPEVTRDGLWLLGNVATGPAEHARAVIDAGFVPVLVALLRQGLFEVRREAAHTVCNIASSPPALPVLLQEGAVEATLPLTSSKDWHLVERVVELAGDALALGSAARRRLEAAGVIDNLETVGYCDQAPPELARASSGLVDRFFGEDYGKAEEEEEEEEEAGHAGFGGIGNGSASAFGQHPPAGGRGRGAVLPAWMQH